MIACPIYDDTPHVAISLNTQNTVAITEDDIVNPNPKALFVGIFGQIVYLKNNILAAVNMQQLQAI